MKPFERVYLYSLSVLTVLALGMALPGSKPNPAVEALVRLPPMSCVTPCVVSLDGAVFSSDEMPAEGASLVVEPPVEEAEFLVESVDPS